MTPPAARQISSAFAIPLFRRSAWTWPPGLSPDYGLQFSSSIVFSDSVPLLAIPLKLLSPLLPAVFQYTGWWVLVCLVLHVWGAFALRARSSASRGRFKRTNLMGGWQSTATKSMIWTGIILLLFIIFHLLDLTLGQAVASDEFVHGAVRNNLLATFAPGRWWVTLVYVVANLALLLHLTHGIYLAVSDLGWLGKRGEGLMVILAYILPFIVVAGNVVMPLAIAFGWVPDFSR